MTESRRRIGLPSLVALVVANSIGVGVFTSSGFGLAALPPGWLLLAWLVGGLVAIAGALCYSALAEAMPESGGEYLYLARIGRPWLGYLAGWVSLTAGFSAAIAAAALALPLYLEPLLGREPSPRLVASLVIVLISVMHGFRLKGGLWTQNGIVALKLGLLAAFLIFGATHLPELPARATSELPGPSVSAFGAQLVWIFFAYAGWNATVYLAGEVRDPQRNARRSLLLGTGVVLAFYLALNAVFVYSAPREELAGNPRIALLAAEAIGGEGFATGMALVIVLALVSSVSAMLLAGPRVYAQMAEDGIFAGYFRFRGDVPGRAILLQAAFALLVVWIQDLEDILSSAGLLLWLSSAAAVSMLFVLARRGQRPRHIGYPIVPALFVLSSLGAGLSFAIRQPDQILISLGVLVVGALGLWLHRGLLQRGLLQRGARRRTH